VEEELLCAFPGPSADTITGGHLVTFVHITHMGIVILNDQKFHGIARFISVVSFCCWGMMYVGWYIDLQFVLPASTPQFPSYLGHYITFLHLQVLQAKIGRHVLSVVADCTTVIYFPFIEIIKQCFGRRNNCPCTIYGPILSLFR
jgi:hypothetical protein